MNVFFFQNAGLSPSNDSSLTLTLETLSHTHQPRNWFILCPRRALSRNFKGFENILRLRVVVEVRQSRRLKWKNKEERRSKKKKNKFPQLLFQDEEQLILIDSIGYRIFFSKRIILSMFINFKFQFCERKREIKKFVFIL